jgi:glycine/D-amino acid oxidase-like deaminating enzyme
VSPFLTRGIRADVDRAPIDRGVGYGVVERCAWLDVNAWLDAQRARLVADDVLREAWINNDDIREHTEHIEVHGDTAPFAILCAGPFADRLPGLVPVRGELMTVRIPELKLRTVLHRGVFVLPLDDDLYRVGSTFAWNDPFSGPTEEARTFLLGQLKKLTTVPVEVIDHKAGVRPTSRDRRPIIGALHDHPRIAVLNGLGARGVLLAPWCAKHLIDHLFDGTSLDPEVDAQRFA